MAADPDSNGREPLIRFVDAEKHFGDAGSALRGVNLEVYDGEFLTILGPSGSGKSTALMVLAGFESLSAGDVLFKGRSLSDIPAQHRNFGVVFQSRALFPHLSALANVAYPLRMRGIDRADALKRAREALATVRLASVADQQPGKLSRGEQQRVALARVLVFEPDVILMDEPLAALDVGLAHQMEEEIRRLHDERGNTVVYVTQDHTEAIAMADRIAILRDGLIQQIGTPAALYERPANAFVAQFVGETNILLGTVTSQSEDRCEVTLDTGEEIAATPVSVSGAGARTRLSVRPERIRLGVAHEPDSNRFPATVDQLGFRGDHTLVHVVLASGTGMLAKIQHADDVGIAAGDRVEISWQAQHCRALDAPGG